MELVNPSAAERPDENAAMDSRFAEMCEIKLGLDESTTRQAMLLFKETKQFLLGSMSALASGTPEEMERHWSAFVLYCVTKLRTVKEGKGASLYQILRAHKLNVVEFFNEISQFCLKVGSILSGLYGSNWEKRLQIKESQANIVHLKLLSRYYKRAYEELFGASDVVVLDSMGDAGLRRAPDYYRFGWLLFLVLRLEALSLSKDLVTCANGLISVLATLIIHVPVHMRNFNIQECSLFVKKSDKGIDLIASLCDKYCTIDGDLRSALEKTKDIIVDTLKRKPLSASECNADNLAFIDPAGLTYFEHLLEGESLQSNLLILEKVYEEAISANGELDERLFVGDEDSFIGSGSLSGGAISLCSTKRKLTCLNSPAKSITDPVFSPKSLSSPVNANGLYNPTMAPVTPVSTAMSTAMWLRSSISTLPPRPSSELLHFFSACDKDCTDEIIERANVILGAIFTNTSFGHRCMSAGLQTSNSVDAIWSEQRKMESIKLYYRVLESICRAERQMLHATNLTSLLCNERFHRCMLACSAELVLATHKTVTMMFPAVLEKAGITAFDLSKVIESFVRHEDSLPRELKRHLNSLEERLLESMAWEKGSSMYNSLIVARPDLSTEINNLGLLAEPMPSLDNIAMHTNISSGGLSSPFQKIESSHGQNGEAGGTPKKPRLGLFVDCSSFKSPVKGNVPAFSSPKPKVPPLQSSFASPTRPNPARGGETCAETGVEIFFNKISKLAAIRIRSLCERMQLSQQIAENVYSLIQKILSRQTALFFNRHVDQLILCCIYGVAKISQMSLTFKEIIFNYRKQPQCKPQVFRSVFVHWPSKSRNGRIGEDHVDIITFYNELFIPSVKPLLVELGSSPVENKNSKSVDVKSSTEGTFPESPRVLLFPHLPDMSPKKVSASHNIFVSPLRSPKMDSLLSPSSKSYYACVGESTHAYQSPSKDLSVINNRLNSGRKVNGRLNFDMVSDSVVVGSLDHQNGSSGSAPVAVFFKEPVKCEPSDG